MHQVFQWTMVFAIAFAGSNKAVFAQKPIVAQLPGKYSQFAWGGAGRFVAVHLAEEEKVLVYDLAEDSLKLMFEIPGIPAGNIVVASQEKLLIVSPDSMTIRRWDLQSGEREELVTIKGSDPPQVAALGYAGDGPLLLVGRRDAAFFDLRSLRPRSMKGKMIAGTGEYGLSVHASPNGQTFGTIPVGIGPVAYGALHLEKSEILSAKFGGTSNATRWAQPSGDGYLMMLPNGEVFTGHGRPFKAERLKGATLIPTPDPGLILEMRLDSKLGGGTMTVCSTADGKPIHTVTGFKELFPPSATNVQSALKSGSEWRVMYAPEIKRIITLPQSNDRIIIRSYDLEEKLKAENQKYLYLASTPPLSVVAGQRLAYAMDVKSSGKTFDVTLEDRPRKTVLTGKTNLRWTAPLDYPSPWARFSLTIRDGDDQVLVHSFEVAILPLRGR